MSDQFIGQTLADKYQIESLIRDGESNRLYRATHLLMDKPVTVKILAPELAPDENKTALFLSEAKRISQLAHPNILNATDFGTDKNGAAYIIFDGADGEILSETLLRVGKLPVERSVRIAAQIAAALSAAHASNIVHGQLNSDNVLLTRNPTGVETVKLLDFSADETTENPLSLKAMQYQSPEQNSLGAKPDARSDVYALGVIFYETLANEVPFIAGTTGELLIKQSQSPPAPLSAFRTDIIPDIEPIILKALAKNPELRYQTAHEFAEDLNRATDNGIGAETIVKPLPTDAPTGTNNNLWKTAFVVLAGIALLAVSLIYATQTKQTTPTTTLQADANGQPVQPINPATGMNEQGTAGLTPYNQGQAFANSNMPLTSSGMPQPVPNGDGYGDGYNPWSRGGVPPPGAPPTQPGGQYIDPNNPNSIFMQDGTVLVPVPVNGNVAVRPTPTGKPTPANVNANTAPAPTPAANPAANPSPNPVKTPVAPIVKPSPKPTAPPPTQPKPPSATQKDAAQSGKPQDG
ncbi:MAG: serine/threonine protein kinase [Acidobacteriota bacterium]|nr:serine/threonine protein kinase [Acidobacteriota bacterium]